MLTEIKQSHEFLHQFTVPFVISTALHALLLLFIILFFYRYYENTLKSESRRAKRIDSITMSYENAIGRPASDQSVRGGARGLSGLHDEAGREPLKAARSRISINPGNFLDAARIKNLKDELNARPLKKNDSSYSFSTGIDHKSKTDFQESYESICSIIDHPANIKVSLSERSDGFSAAALEYLNGTRAVRSWRTLWLVKKPATGEDKIELCRLLCRLKGFILFGGDAEQEYMRESIDHVFQAMPDELKNRVFCR